MPFVAAVFTAIAVIFATVPDIFPAVKRPALMPSVPPILAGIANILTAIAAIFPMVPGIFHAVEATLDPIHPELMLRLQPSFRYLSLAYPVHAYQLDT